MPIPSFTIDGVLPPCIGASGPGGHPSDMTPYVASAVEVVTVFGTTPFRRTLLANWLKHREDVRKLGFQRGFQWLDGSFVEDKAPQDLDIVTFSRRPSRAAMKDALERLLRANPAQFRRSVVKASYQLDVFFVDLDGTREALVDATRYYTGLFSHRRADDQWKGMVQVDLGDAAGDAIASAALAAVVATTTVTTTP